MALSSQVRGLAWLWRRLQRMDSEEVLYRVRQSLRERLERIQRPDPEEAMRPGATFGDWTCELPRAIDASLYARSADRILEGYFTIFALTERELGFPPSWNRDPKTGVSAPRRFGRTINYRKKELVGDIRYLWELNRHHELVTLAQAWYLTGDERYAIGCQRLLGSWIDECPYGIGPNWSSALEVAIRLTNWAFTWKLLGAGDRTPGARLDEALRARWLKSIYQHCYFIARYLSQHSSANNHLLGEYMGLFVGAVVWPLWTRSQGWLETGKNGLEIEARKQIAPDGVNLEQAIWYQHEVADMLLVSALIGRANGIEFSREYWQRIEAMLEFVASIMDAGGHVPSIGDSDDGVVIRFVPRRPRREAQAGEGAASEMEDRAGIDVFRSLLCTGATLFQRGDFKRKAGSFDAKTRWLLGDAAAIGFERLAEPASHEPVKRAFPVGGYWIIGRNFEAADEVRLVADAGPLGYLAIAAHGHADALSLTLSVAGTEILVDPGTYEYHGNEPWRDYFRSTAAHNTVRIDGLDQSVITGPFMWAKHATGRCLHFSSDSREDVWRAEHDGYLRLDDPVLHQREVLFCKETSTLRVTDRLRCTGAHDVEVNWHVSSSCSVFLHGRTAHIDNERARVTVTMSGETGLEPHLVRGRDDPPLGWVSRSFGRKEPATCLTWCGSISGDTSLVTTFKIQLK